MDRYFAALSMTKHVGSTCILLLNFVQKYNIECSNSNLNGFFAGLALFFREKRFVYVFFIYFCEVLLIIVSYADYKGRI